MLSNSIIHLHYITYSYFKHSLPEIRLEEELIEEAEFISFLIEPTSEESKAFINSLIEIAKPDMGRRNKPSAEFILAMERMIPALFKAAQDDPRSYVYRSISPNSFTPKPWEEDAGISHPVRYRPFIRVVEGLEREGFLEVVKGFKECTALASSKGVATRFRATEKLFNLGKGYNILPECWSNHFGHPPRPKMVSNPIILRSDSVNNWKDGKSRGETLPVDYSLPHVSTFAEDVNKLNAYFATQDIEPAHLHHRFARIFGEGNKDGANFTKGGRLYSYGIGKSYQNIRKHARRKMTICGEPVAEVDLRASYLTILHQHMGVPLPANDPYIMPDVPRGIVKMWVSITLGNGGFHKRWPDLAKERYRDDGNANSKDLQADYPIGDTQRKILAHLPLLKDWAKNPIGWGDLQLPESTAIIAAIKTLAFDHDIPALPLHDALMVQESKAEIAAQCLWESFYKHVGIEPHITVSTHGQKTKQI